MMDERRKPLLVSQLNEARLTDEQIDRLLFAGLEDQGQKADCILVLGSNKAVQYRVPVAAAAYHDGRAPKMLLCGGASDGVPEALLMKEKAMQLGVPDEAILVEDRSQNTIENMLFALVELQRAFWLNRVKSVLLVTTPCHMRRSLHIARYLFPAHIAIYPCPAEDTHTRRSNWMLTEHGRERAMAEAQNLIRCVRNGVFPDFEL